MIADPFPLDVLSSLERPLYAQLLILAGVAGGLGWASGGWAWGLSAALGMLTALSYYKLLALQTRRQFATRQHPGVPHLVILLALRQMVCLAVPALCFVAFGQAGLACLATLVIGRHWILVVAWPKSGGPSVAV